MEYVAIILYKNNYRNTVYKFPLGSTNLFIRCIYLGQKKEYYQSADTLFDMTLTTSAHVFKLYPESY